MNSSIFIILECVTTHNMSFGWCIYVEQIKFIHFRFNVSARSPANPKQEVKVMDIYGHNFPKYPITVAGEFGYPVLPDGDMQIRAWPGRLIRLKNSPQSRT